MLSRTIMFVIHRGIVKNPQPQKRWKNLRYTEAQNSRKKSNPFSTHEECGKLQLGVEVLTTLHMQQA